MSSDSTGGLSQKNSSHELAAHWSEATVQEPVDICCFRTQDNNSRSAFWLKTCPFYNELGGILGTPTAEPELFLDSPDTPRRALVVRLRRGTSVLWTRRLPVLEVTGILLGSLHLFVETQGSETTARAVGRGLFYRLES